MASAVLASQNDSTWDPMGKITYSNPHMAANPNPNSKKKQKQFHENAARYQQPHHLHHNSSNFDSPVVTQTASDDAYSFNQPSTSRNAVNYGGYVNFQVSIYTKSELVSLRKRLLAELDQVREFRSRIETGGLEISKSKVQSKKVDGNTKYVATGASVPKKLNNGYDPGSYDPAIIEALMKECSKIVPKLVKHKYGYLFRVPVDAASLGLHDYHMIVKKPMDLGTVKNNLSNGTYSTPLEFASDVRLTFNNALLYNPKHDLVHGVAEQLLARFEELFRPVQEKMDMHMNQRREGFCEYGDNGELQQLRAIDELQGSSWNNMNQVVSSPLRSKKVKSKSSPVDQVFKKLDRLPVAVQAHSSASTPSNPPPPVNQSQFVKEFTPSPVRAPPPVKEQKMGRGTTVRQPKPKAKDPNKRDMSMEEKQKLGLGLQSLPQEKMPQLIQIIRKRNEHLAQDGDEIELDIEALDTETLWELDRFVTNWKKMVSKTKRQALIMNKNVDGGSAPLPPSSMDAEHDMGDVMIDKDNDIATKVKENEDEDVDIDDDTPTAHFPQ